MSKVDFLQKQLSEKTGLSLDIKMNQNEKTMISIYDSSAFAAKVSLHEIFLSASDIVLEALARFIAKKRKKQDEKDRVVLRHFIHEKLSSYSATKKELLTSPQGEIYDLQEMYAFLNAAWFDNALKLQITWYGKAKKSSGALVILGEYIDHLKLIKIHQMLDHKKFPLFFVQYIVFHEMLHAVYPAHPTKRGVKIHTKEFLAAEKKYSDYAKVLVWKEKYNHLFFR